MAQDARKLMGRLYPVVQQIRDQESSGGGGERISPQDIAGAVGMLPDCVEKRIFLAMNWPESVDIPELFHDLHHELYVRWSVLETSFHKDFCRRLGSNLPHSNPPERWKHSPRVYARIPAACLVEVMSGTVCPVCCGEVEECPACGGTGLVPLSYSKRAELLTLSRRTFCRDWTPPYVWMLKRMRKADDLVARSLAAALA